MNPVFPESPSHIPPFQSSCTQRAPSDVAMTTISSSSLSSSAFAHSPFFVAHNHKHTNHKPITRRSKTSPLPRLQCCTSTILKDEGKFDLHSYWNSMIAQVDSELQKAVPLRYPSKIHEAMRYSVLARGKRAPPIMCVAACEAVGGTKEQALPTACALEMVHTASLIHDDLPYMDNDPLRRGQPSNHTVFGVDMALLAGDALFPLCFEYIVSSMSDVPADRLLRVIAQISSTVGSRGMIAGQYLDLGSTGIKKVDPALVEFIHEYKFGIMAECSAVCGGIIGGASDKKLERLQNYGRMVGVLYQVVDDILEEEANLEDNGVLVKKNKASYPRAYGLEKAKEIAGTLRSNAKSELSCFDRAKAAPLYSFVDYAVDRSFDV